MADAMQSKAQEDQNERDQQKAYDRANAGTSRRRLSAREEQALDERAVALLESRGVSHDDAVAQVEKDGSEAVLASGFGPGQTGAPIPAEPKKIPFRAKFIVTDISKSLDGTCTIKLQAAYDHTIDPKRAIIAGANPKGMLELVISAEVAAAVQHNSVFYLMSA
jgi:hypothetical protein